MTKEELSPAPVPAAASGAKVKYNLCMFSLNDFPPWAICMPNIFTHVFMWSLGLCVDRVVGLLTLCASIVRQQGLKRMVDK